MSYFKNEIRKFKQLYYVKLLLLLSFITLSLIFIFLLIPPKREIFGRTDFTLNWILIGLLSFLILTFISSLTVLSINQYKDYIRKKTIIIEGNYYLSFKDIFENENRRKIISQVLQEPGIHHNELLRKCNVQKGQLQWHLYILLKYGIIKKEKIGQYVTFFPLFSQQESYKIPLKLIRKSKTSLKILNIIEENPGINSSKIAKKLNIRRSSVKYHVDKLAKLELIILEKDNRETKLYTNREVVYE